MKLHSVRVLAGLSLLCIALHGQEAVAQAIPTTFGTNLLKIPTSSGTNTAMPPAEFTEELSTTGGAVVPAAFRRSYTYKTENGRFSIQVTLTNPTSSPVSYRLYLSKPVATTASGATLNGVRYVFSGSILGTNNIGPDVRLGYHLASNSAYLSEVASTRTPYRIADVSSDQPVSQEFIVGAPRDGSSNPTPPTTLQPRVTVYSVPAGGTVSFTLKAPTLIATDKPASPIVNALSQPSLFGAAGKALKLDVSLFSVAQANPGTLKSSLVAVDDLGVSIALGTRPMNEQTLGGWGWRVDPWQVTLPANMQTGRYRLRYKVLNASNGPVVLKPAFASMDVGGSSYELGQVIVHPSAGMYIGQHFHRYPGTSQNVFGARPPVSYQFVRSHDHEQLGGTRWWREGGIDWTHLDAWANFHSANDNKLVLTFYGTPRWASLRPTEDSAYASDCANPASTNEQCGMRAPPKDMAAYQAMVKAVVTRYRDKLFAVECSNEPDLAQFYTGTPTQLADICKAVHTGTAQAIGSSGFSIPVLCPAAADVWKLHLSNETILDAKTSVGAVPIHQYCDMVGAHLYNVAGRDANGNPYSSASLLDQIKSVTEFLRHRGINKPIAVTEMGFGTPTPGAGNYLPFQSMDGQNRGTVVMQSLLEARSAGVQLVGLYSFDEEPKPEFPHGYEGNLASAGALDAAAVLKLNDAVTQLGRGQALTHVRALDASLSIDKTTAALNTPVNYTFTVFNMGLLPTTGVGLSFALPAGFSSTTVASSQGVCTKAASIVCNIGTLNPQSAVVVQFSTKPSSRGDQQLTIVARGDKVPSVVLSKSLTVQ